MGNPLRHLPRTNGKKMLHAMAADMLEGNGWNISQALWCLCDFALSLMGLPQKPETAKFPRVTVWLEMYQELVMAHEPFEDILGALYMALASNSKKAHMGQYFTPWEVARLNAYMLGSFKKPGGSPLCSIHDPTCGSGSMILAALSVHLEREGPEGLRWLSVSGIDLDPLCARMAALQVLANVNLHKFELGHLAIVHGNSLSLETTELVVCAHRRDLDVDSLRGRYLGIG